MSALVAVSLSLTFAALPASLSLDEALELARDKAPLLREQRAQVEASTARARQALAPVLPTISSSISYSRSTSNFVARPGTLPSGSSSASSITLDTADYWSGNLTAQGTLWDFGQGWKRYQASLSTADAAAAQLHATEVATALQVRTAYFLALTQKDLVDVAKAALDNAQQHLEQVQGFVTVGTRPEIDLAQSRADKANARLALVNALNDAAVARARLNLSIGLERAPAWELVGVSAAPTDGEELTLEALVDEALKARPEVAGLEAQVRAQQFLLGSTRGALWPSLGLSLGATLGARSLDAVVPNLNGQLTLSWQFYQGGLTTAQLTEQDATLRNLEAQRDALRQQVHLDVEQALTSLHSAKEGVDVAQEVVDAAKERLRLAQGRYTSGAGSALELADAQVQATNSSAQKVRAVYGLATARAQLQAALGR